MSASPAAEGGMYRANRNRNIDTWATFFRQCWRRALDYHAFELEAKRLFIQAPLNNLDIFEAWSRQIKVQRNVTPRMLHYLDILQRLKMLGIPTILNATMNNLAVFFDQDADLKIKARGSPEIGALSRLTANTIRRFQNKTVKKRSPETVISMRLFKLIGLFAGAAVSRGGIVAGTTLALGEAIADYLVAHVNDLHETGVLTLQNGRPPPVLRKAFSRVVPTFIQVLTASASPSAGSLSLLQQQSKLQEGLDDSVEEVATASVDATSFSQTQQLDSPVSPTRASLYAYLTGALIAAPKLDDVGLQVFLAARYNEDIKSMSVDLVTTGFDVLAGALERKESMEVIVIHRSFIANKLPSILEQLAQHPSFQSGAHTMRRCVTDAIKKVDESYRGTAVLQPGSDACPKQRFLLACALFGFIEEAAVPTLLGYPPTQGLPQSGRYDKSKLVQECQADTKRIEQLVGELHLMEGNASAITGALLEILHTLCANRDTMTLKILCVAFLKKPHNTNIMLLFANARLLLQPLCHLLDHWQVQDDQGEQLIVYDEFGSILLFVLMCQYRYDLPLSAFTSLTPDSFLMEFFQNGTLAKYGGDLDDTDRKQLVGWIKGLFGGDGLGDEVLSACSPKDFYRFVATLTDQIMAATQTGVLGIDTAKSGAEYLLAPFLLPSLTIVLPIFVSRLSSMASDSPQLDFLMPILMSLLKPPTLSPDAQPLHQVALFISAKPLSQALTHVKSIQRGRKDVPQMLDAIKQFQQKPFTIGATKQLLEEWFATKDPSAKVGGIAATFASSVDNLLKWNSPGKTVPDRQAYNHRLTVSAINTIGAVRTLDIMLDQAARAATNPKATDQALDTLTGLVAATTLTNSSQDRLTVRDALLLADRDAQTRPVSKHAGARASLTMRLARRVELHCAKPLEQAPPVVIALAADSVMPDASVAQASALESAVVAAAAQAVDLKDIPMPDSSELMAGLADAAAAGIGGVKDGSALQMQQQQAQQGLSQASAVDLLSMGDMGDMGDRGFEDFLHDLNVGETQNFDEIFNNL